jgi:hypothetical protein
LAKKSWTSVIDMGVSWFSNTSSSGSPHVGRDCCEALISPVLELWAVIRNCPKPLLGMRVVFTDDNCNSLKSNTWFWHITTILNLLKIWNNHQRTNGSLILIILILGIDSHEQNQITTKLCKYPYGSMWKCYQASWIGTQVCFAQPFKCAYLKSFLSLEWTSTDQCTMKDAVGFQFPS